jgi:hypothetical protein
VTARAFKPGPRRKAGRISDGTVAWLDTFLGRITLKVFEDNPMAGEAGFNTGIVVRYATGGYRTIDLTALTEAEWNEFRNFMALVEETVLPVIQERDKVARDAYRAGDGSFARSYRAIPAMVVIERPPAEHSQGVLNGSSDASPGDSGEHQPGEFGGAGDVLAQQDSIQDEAEDDSKEDS